MNNYKKILSIAFIVFCSWPAILIAQTDFDEFEPSQSNWGFDFSYLSIESATGTIFLDSYFIKTPSVGIDSEIGLYGYPVSATTLNTRYGVSVNFGIDYLLEENRGQFFTSNAYGKLLLSRMMGSNDTKLSLLYSHVNYIYDIESSLNKWTQEFGISVEQIRMPISLEPNILIDVLILRDLKQFDAYRSSLGFNSGISLPGGDKTVLVGVAINADNYFQRKFDIRSSQLKVALDSRITNLMNRILSINLSSSLQIIKSQKNKVIGQISLILR